MDARLRANGAEEKASVLRVGMVGPAYRSKMMRMMDVKRLYTTYHYYNICNAEKVAYE